MDLAELDRITLTIIQAGIEVHRTLGPGLLESIYLACLVYELGERGLRCRLRRSLFPFATRIWFLRAPIESICSWKIPSSSS